MKIGKYNVSRSTIIIFLSAFIVLFNIYNLAWIPVDPYVQRGTFIIVFVLLAILLKPPESTPGKICIGIFTLMILAGTIYVMIFVSKLGGRYHPITATEIYMFLLFMIGLSGVLTRIEGGVVILEIMVASILYLVLGRYIPGQFGLTPLPMDFLVSTLYIDISQGAFGSFTEIMVRVISIFMVFAAFLQVTGLGDLFTAISCRVAGNATGGPAKVSVLSSAAFGMISGSAVANVVATGSFTIPTMKNVGYEPSMAATVEALASTGGLIMPPIMGVAAFVMAEILGIPYFRVCLAAIVPAFMWYLTCYMIVHFYALKQGIRKWRPSQEEFMKVIKDKFHLLSAILVLMAALYYFAAAEQGALWATVFLFFVAFLRKGTRLTKAKLAAFLQNYAQMYAGLFVLSVAIAVFIGAFVGSGVHLKIGALLMGGVQNDIVILLIAAGLTFVLGLGLTGLPTYLAAVMIVAPMLGKLGYNLLSIHMFIFYMSSLGPITPPVAMAVFQGARIAGAPLWKTSIEATIKSLPLWIFPFAIVKKGLLLGIGTPLGYIGIEVAILSLGMLLFVLGTEGYFRRRLTVLERAVTILISLLILQPVSDFYARIFAGVGILLLIFWFLSGLSAAKKAKQENPSLSSG